MPRLPCGSWRRSSREWSCSRTTVAPMSRGTGGPPLSRIFWTTCLDSFLIPNNRWLKFMSGRRRMRRGLFGDTPEAPRVSPKPYARSRAARPPTACRPASAIPRDVRGKRNPARRPSAGCLLCNPRVASFRRASASPRTGHGRDRRRLPFGSGRVPAFRARAAEARGESRRVFRARRDWRRAGSPRGADAEAKARGLIHLAESCRGTPEKARSELLPAPQRWIRSLSAIARSENPG